MSAGRYRDRCNTGLHFWRDSALDGICLVRARYDAYRIQRHFHDEMVIAVTEDGLSKCLTRAGKTLCGPGTVWIGAAAEYHSAEIEAGGHWQYRGIYLDDSRLRSLGRVLSDETSERLWVPQGLYEDPQLARLLLRAHRCLEEQACALERQTRWWAALGMLFGRYGEPRPKPERRSAGKRSLKAVRDFLADNLSRQVSIAELTEVSGLTRFHLIRSFSREYGLPPHAYANQLRLVAVRRLVCAGERLAHAATAVGFYDQSHLTRLFSRTYGLTPGAYRRLHEVVST